MHQLCASSFLCMLVCVLYHCCQMNFLYSYLLMIHTRDVMEAISPGQGLIRNGFIWVNETVALHLRRERQNLKSCSDITVLFCSNLTQLFKQLFCLVKGCSWMDAWRLKWMETFTTLFLILTPTLTSKNTHMFDNMSVWRKRAVYTLGSGSLE